ncbi:hypothetical protein [Taibaiella chishuiensis]|uniref:TerB family tellurite resistance protein n=1 Tax=Taibaiella chishuiensis TaxID=1434707 RepID=A0A2P8D0N8_9BACT|nr:hypothetical protein [Taibaiella chishuiensis]PSK90781.1 hypothetical protein B0I18_107193 [Taibaiella chishuiensis]
MKRKLIILLILFIGLGQFKVKAQSTEVVQLLLNVEKLSQLKQILSDLKKGYTIVSTGYNTIKNLSEGNFNIHKIFLDGLLEASPVVKKYYKVAGIVELQLLLIKEHRSAFNRFRNGNMLRPSELEYIGKVYSNLVTESLRNIDELLNVVTTGKLRMSDDERLKTIDGLYADMEDKLNFLRSFNNNTTILTIQRAKEFEETSRARRIYGIN